MNQILAVASGAVTTGAAIAAIIGKVSTLRWPRRIHRDLVDCLEALEGTKDLPSTHADRALIEDSVRVQMSLLATFMGRRYFYAGRSTWYYKHRHRVIIGTFLLTLSMELMAVVFATAAAIILGWSRAAAYAFGYIVVRISLVLFLVLFPLLAFVWVQYEKRDFDLSIANGHLHPDGSPKWRGEVGEDGKIRLVPRPYDKQVPAPPGGSGDTEPTKAGQVVDPNQANEVATPQ